MKKGSRFFYFPLVSSSKYVSPSTMPKRTTNTDDNNNSVNKTTHNKKSKVKVEEDETTEETVGTLTLADYEDMTKEDLVKEMLRVIKENNEFKKELEDIKSKLTTALAVVKSVNSEDEESDDDDDEEDDPTQVDDVWHIKLQELREYRILNGNCNVPQKYATSPKLSNWVKWQRQEYGKKKLSTDKVQKLESIGFNWGKKFPSLPTWDESLEELQKY